MNYFSGEISFKIEVSLARDFMPRSLKVHQNYITKVKLALTRNGFPNQRSLAEDVGFALATVSNFLTGKPVDYTTFEELCRKLGLNWREISTLDSDIAAPAVDLHPKPPARNRAIDATHPSILPCYPNGAVPLDSPFYLERTPFEAQIEREIRKPGALVRIKAPREMGKTSLLMRVLDSAQGLGYKTVSLNIERVDATILSDLDRFLRWLCANVARQLQLAPMLDEYWDGDLGSKVSCTAYFQDWVILTQQPELAQALERVMSADRPITLAPILA
jgi:transcriptional regulator with XRE-family HTH domain